MKSVLNSFLNIFQMFLTEGIKRVLVHGCSKVPMFVLGVNHSCFDPAMKAVSAGSPSMNCLLVLLRVLHENFDVQVNIYKNGMFLFNPKK